MKKNEKDYAAMRVKSIFETNKIECECKPPDLMHHLRKAAVEQTLEMLPAKDIKQTARQAVLDCTASRYDSVESLKLDKLFKQPKSYVAEQTAYLVEKEMLKEAKAKRNAKMQDIIDRIYLDRFETAEEAIEAATKAV